MNATPQQALDQLYEASRLAAMPAAAHEACTQSRQMIANALAEIDLMRQTLARKQNGDS